MKKMIFRTVLTAVLVMLSASTYAGEPVKYLDEQGQEKYVTDYKVLTGEENTLAGGWYVVESGVHEVNHPIRFDGDVHIVLMDKSVLRMTVGEEEPLLSNTEIWGANALSVYAQSDGLDMGMVENGGVSVSCFSVRGDLTINGGYILWKPKESAEEPCYDIAMTAARLTVNGGVIKTGGYICGISVSDLVLNGGYLFVDALDIAIAASGSVTFGHSGCEFECDCTNFLYYGDDDMVVDDFVTVQLGDQTYTDAIPYDITDDVTVTHIKSHYDAEKAMVVRGLEECRAEDDSWYSLEGVRLTGRPTKKGVYIHNNRKVIVK